ncbi:hypothetical protein ARMGADRAFT_1070209 [Armillaria gallica]|uniref:Sodium/calcium exchanger membrane region domain-containing protein n=1 Tax=Armillaria gallica TaxID=47427 RepID=A0A2H3EW71_ARMGA|nr:hypothetical protein ARMGADRAFT_1070209 [Armillaria gallica]
MLFLLHPTFRSHSSFLRRHSFAHGNTKQSLRFMDNSNIVQSPHGSEDIAVSDNTHTNISSEPNAETNTTTPPTKRSVTFRDRKATGDTVNTSSPRPTGRYNSLARATTMMLQPEKEIGPSPGVWSSIKAILLLSWLNILLLLIPVSWALHFAFAAEKETIIFVCSFLAVIPLAKLLAFATDELSMRVGEILAGLLNATLVGASRTPLHLRFSDLLSSGKRVCDLCNDIWSVVSSITFVSAYSFIAAVILSYEVLVLGMCFFAGGTKFQEQGFAQMATQLNSSLLAISVIAVLLPAVLHFSVVDNTENNETFDILSVSHGTSIILLFVRVPGSKSRRRLNSAIVYISYLVFQLFSHASLYADEDEDMIKFTRYGAKKHKAEPSIGLQAPKTGAISFATPTALAHRPEDNFDVEGGSSEEVEHPRLSIQVTVGLLIIVTVLVAVHPAVTVEWLVDSIDGMTHNSPISKEFVGVIILPIVCRTPDGVTIVTTSVKDKVDLSMGITVGSSIQIALFVIPFIVTLGWIMGKPLTLLFDPYESVAMFLAVLTVNYVVHYGKSNWLEGMILMCLYAILCVTFWFYSGNNPSGVLLAACS